VFAVVCVLQWHAGDNVGTGDDYTIFSKVEGIVIYSKRPGRNLVSTKQPEMN
jgi:ribosomal protein L27